MIARWIRRMRSGRPAPVQAAPAAPIDDLTAALTRILTGI